MQGSAALAQERVPSDWDGKPGAINAGEQFRLVFATGNPQTTAGSDIAAYDGAVQSLVRGSGHTAIRGYASGFRVLGCTSTVDARTHTGTRATDTGVPIYWVRHSKVADDYDDLYDGSWDSNAARNEAGERFGSNNVEVRTGCSDDGTARSGASLGLAGATVVAVTNAREVRTHGLYEADSNIGTDRRLFGLSPVFQVNTVPASSDGKVTATEDTSYTFTASDFVFSDGDQGDTLASVKVLTLPAAESGSLTLSTVAVSANGVVAAADIVAGNLEFTPAANANGAGHASFTFRVNDGTEDSASSYTMTIDVTAVNDAATGRPTIAGTARVGETLSASTAGIADVDGLPSSGFTWQWIRVATDTSETNIGTGASYTPVAADAGATIVVEVSFTDQGGTPEGPLRSAATAAVNDMATGMPMIPGSPIPQESVPSDWDLKPAAIDAAGQFRLVFVTSNQPQARGSDIAAYDRPVQNRVRGFGHMAIRGYASGFRVLGCTSTVDARTHTETRATDTGVPIYWVGHTKVADDYEDLYDGSWDSNAARNEAGERFGSNNVDVRTGCSDDGTARSGLSLGASNVAGTNAHQVRTHGLHEADVTFENFRTRLFGLSPVFQVNTVPASSDGKVTATEDTSYTFTAADFVFSDGDQGDTLARVTVLTLPVAATGSLTLSGAAVSADDVVTAADIAAGNLEFAPAANANGAGHASFTFKVSDGTEDSASSYTMTIDVTAVNDAATGMPTITGSPEVGRTLTASTAGIADVEGLPSSGFTWRWIRVATDTSETNIGTGASYTPVAADRGATIVVEVSFTDQGGTPEGPLRSAATAAVSGPNAAPTGADKTVNTPEDTAYTFLTGDFAFSDSDTGDALASVTVVMVPVAGTGSLTLSGAAVSADDVVSAADIVAGNLEFTPAANANGAGHAKFTFKVSDGETESASSYTMTIDVTAVNDAATGADKTVNTPEDTAYTFLTGDFVFSDSDMGDTLASVKVVMVPVAGTGSLTLSGAAVSVDAVVTAADIAAGNLEFAPAANANGVGHASFTFRVNDGTEDSASSYTMTIDVTAVNDVATGMPTITDTPVVGRTLTASTVGIADVDGLPSSGFTWQWIRVATDTSETNIGTGASYTLVAADAGATIVVEVSFTDQGGTPEGPLRSAATAVVTTAPTVTSIVRQDPSSTPTNADSLTWRVTFSEAVSNVGTADFDGVRHHGHGDGHGQRDDVRRHRERGQPGGSQRHGDPVLRQRPGHRGRRGQPADRHDPHGHERDRLCSGQHRAHSGDHRAGNQQRALHGDLHLLGGRHGLCPERHRARQRHGLELRERTRAGDAGQP